VGDGERLQRAGLWLGTSPASHLGLSLQGAVSGPGNSLPPAGADCLGEPKRGEWIWRWQPERGVELAASVPTRGPSRPLPGAAEGLRDGSFPSLLRDAFGAAGPDADGVLVGRSRGRGRARAGGGSCWDSSPWARRPCPMPGAAQPAVLQLMAGPSGSRPPGPRACRAALEPGCSPGVSRPSRDPLGSPRHSPSTWRGPLPPPAPAAGLTALRRISPSPRRSPSLDFVRRFVV